MRSRTATHSPIGSRNDNAEKKKAGVCQVRLPDEEPKNSENPIRQKTQILSKLPVARLTEIKLLTWIRDQDETSDSGYFTLG